MKSSLVVFSLTVFLLICYGLFAQTAPKSSHGLSEQVKLQKLLDAKIRLILSNLFASDQAGFKELKLDSNLPELRVKMTEGEIVSTDRDMDIAIAGEGFLMFNDEQSGEIVYSRCGSLNIDPEGYLVLFSKDNVSRQLDPCIAIPDGTRRIQINDDGGVWVVLNGDVENLQQIGQIELAVFLAPEQLKPIDEIFFMESKASRPPMIVMPGIDGAGTLKSQHLERSNVDLDAQLHELRRLRKIQDTL